METLLFWISFWICVLYLLWCIGYASYSYWDIHERVRPATNPSKRVHIDVWKDTVQQPKHTHTTDSKAKELDALRAGLMGNTRKW